MFYRLHTCWLLFLLTTGKASAAPAEQLHAVAGDRYWLALLHIPSGSNRSDIVANDFFLAPQGATDPYAELLATLKQLNAPATADSNSHAQCRFIARFNWLKQKLPTQLNSAPKVDCPLFQQWTDQQQVDSVSAVFASGYLGNPASFYGHILLKLNSNSKNRNLLQQQSLNFGAAVPDEENPLIYILKGLFGGYNAVFSHGLFYKNVQTYGEAELRDLWEYRLQLRPEQVQQLVFHAWELIGRDYQYFFLQQNCAFRMAELMELVIDTELISKTQPWAMPVTVFQRLSATTQENQKIVAEIVHHPSRQQRFTSRYHQLNNKQQLAVSDIIATQFHLQQESFAELSDAEKSAVLEMLFDYIEFLRINEQPLYSVEAKSRLLQARLALPAASADTFSPPRATAPDQATRPSMLQLGAVHNNTNTANIRFRATYYDLLTAETGGAPYSALSMFDIALRYDDKLSLYRFDLLNIENMNLSATGLPGDGGYAWKLNLAYAPLDLACTDCQVIQLNSGIGKATLLQNNLLLYALLDGSIHSNANGSGIASWQPRLGLLTDIAPWWRMQLELGRQHYFNTPDNAYNWYQWQHRFGNATNWDLRLSIAQKRATEISLAYSWYW